MSTVAVIGAGAFGTALAEIAARSQAVEKVNICARSAEVVNSINSIHRNPRFMFDYELNSKIVAVDSVAQAVESASICILAIPTQLVPDWLVANRDVFSSEIILVNTAKGLYLREKCLLSEAVFRALGQGRANQPYVVLSGPSFAIEIIKNHPTAVVVASKYLYHAVHVQRLLSTPYFRCYSSQDVIGVELGGALKNPLAIGAGMIEGSGLGINTMAAYITRSSLELQLLCKAMGGEAETISGLAGIGDLILTAFGDLSRNRTLGIRMTRGESLEDVTKEVTVEGVPTSFVAIDFANRKTEDRGRTPLPDGAPSRQ
eukprot:gene30682-39962_t